MIFPFAELPDELKSLKTTRAAFFHFTTSDEQKKLIQEAIDSIFSESQRARKVNGYLVARLLALHGFKLASENAEFHAPENISIRFVKTLDLVNLFSDYGTNIAKGSLNAALQLLVKQNLLIARKVNVDSENKREWTVYEFASAESLSETITSASLKKYAPTNKESRSTNRKRDASEQKQILDLVDIQQDDAKLNRNHLPNGVAFLEQVIPKPVWDLAYNKDGPHNLDYRREQVDGFVIEIKGHKKITTKPALITGLILMQIAIAYNAKMLSQGKFEKPFEKRDIPIFASDLMSFKGSDSGPARERTANEIELLRNTVYDIHDLNPTFSESHQRNQYTKDDYRILESVRSSSDFRYSADDPSANIRNASLYIIRFSEEVETLLSREEIMFTLPTLLLSAHNLLVTFYLHLRRQRVDREVITFDNLIYALPFTGSANTLKERLEKILNTPVKSEDNTRSSFETGHPDFDYNLFGYYIKFIQIEGEPALDIECNKKEMIIAAGAKYNEDPKANNAPTIANPLIWLSQTSDEIQHTKEIQHAVDMLKKDFIRANTLRNSRYRVLCFNNKSVYLTAYCSKIFIKALCYELSQNILINVEILEEALLRIQSELNKIKLRDIIIESDDIDNLIRYLTARCEKVPTEQDIVVHTSSFRQKKLLQWKACEFDSFADALVNDLNDAYKDMQS